MITEYDVCGLEYWSEKLLNDIENAKNEKDSITKLAKIYLIRNTLESLNKYTAGAKDGSPAFKKAVQEVKLLENLEKKLE